MDFVEKKRRRRTDRWETHRHYIEQLYIEQDLTLKEVMEEMRNPPHDFEATEQAYKKRIAQWGLSKNVPAAIVQEMMSVEEKRSRNGKETLFYWHNIPVAREKIHRTKKRLLKSTQPEPPTAELLKHLRCVTPPISPDHRGGSISNNVINIDPLAGDLPASARGISKALLGSRLELDVPSTRLSKKIYATSSQHTYSMIEAKLKLLQKEKKDTVFQCSALLNDYDQFSDVRTTFESLRGIVSTIDATTELATCQWLHQVLIAQERLVAAHLFLLGKNDKEYLSQCLMLCYLASYTEDLEPYTALFNRIAPQAFDLEWPFDGVDTLIKLALTFIDEDTTSDAATKLLGSLLTHLEFNPSHWNIRTLLHTIRRTERIQGSKQAEELLLPTMKVASQEARNWEKDDLLTLQAIVFAHDWDTLNTNLLPYIHNFIHQFWKELPLDAETLAISNYFEFARLTLRFAFCSASLTDKLSSMVVFALETAFQVIAGRRREWVQSTRLFLRELADIPDVHLRDVLAQSISKQADSMPATMAQMKLRHERTNSSALLNIEVDKINCPPSLDLPSPILPTQRTARGFSFVSPSIIPPHSTISLDSLWGEWDPLSQTNGNLSRWTYHTPVEIPCHSNSDHTPSTSQSQESLESEEHHLKMAFQQEHTMQYTQPLSSIKDATTSEPYSSSTTGTSTTSTWSLEDEAKLIQLCEAQTPLPEILKRFKGKRQVYCRVTYRRLTKWTSAELSILQNGRKAGKSWEDIASDLPQKTAAACRTYYEKHARHSPVNESFERGRSPRRASNRAPHPGSPLINAIASSDIVLSHPGYDGSGYISPAALSRDASPSGAALPSPDSRRQSQASVMSGPDVFNERLRTAAKARRSSIYEPPPNTTSVPSSPFRPNSAFASEWPPLSGAASERRGSAPSLLWQRSGLSFNDPFA